MRNEKLRKTDKTANITSIDCTLKGCWGLLRGHEDDDRLVKAPRHAGEGAAVVRVDDEEEGPASERVQIAGMKAAKKGKRKNAENETAASESD